VTTVTTPPPVAVRVRPRVKRDRSLFVTPVIVAIIVIAVVTWINAQDFTVLGGSLGHAHAQKSARSWTSPMRTGCR